jgi:hypothetical protein
VAALVTAAAATLMGSAHPALVSSAVVYGETEVDHPGFTPAVTTIGIRYAVMRRHYNNGFSNQ